MCAGGGGAVLRCGGAGLEQLLRSSGGVRVSHREERDVGVQRHVGEELRLIGQHGSAQADVLQRDGLLEESRDGEDVSRRSVGGGSDELLIPAGRRHQLELSRGCGHLRSGLSELQLLSVHGLELRNHLVLDARHDPRERGEHRLALHAL